MCKRILVTEDEADIRCQLRMLLESSGYQVEEAEDGAQALQKLEQRRFDLMLLDLRMPVKDGFCVLDALTPEQRETLPVVVVSASHRDRDIVRGFSLGAVSYITKPFTNGELLTTIRYFFGGCCPGEHFTPL